MFSKLGKKSQISEKKIYRENYFTAVTFITGIDKKEREEYWARLRIRE